MLRIVHVEEIAAHLLRVPALVREQASRSFSFADNVAAWLVSLETVLSANQLYQAGRIATLRSGLVAAQHGQIPAGIEFRGLPSRLKVLNAVASQALQAGSEIAAAVVAEHRPRILEGERVAQQIIAAALSRGVVMPRPAGGSNTHYLRELRRNLAASADLEAGTVHLEGLVGPHDTLVLLDRALSPHINAAPAPDVPAAALSLPG
jgi:hypothetical protein